MIGLFDRTKDIFVRSMVEIQASLLRDKKKNYIVSFLLPSCVFSLVFMNYLPFAQFLGYGSHWICSDVPAAFIAATVHWL